MINYLLSSVVTYSYLQICCIKNHSFRLVLNLPDTVMLKRDNLKHLNFPSLKFADYEGEMGENIMWVNISLYTVIHVLQSIMMIK